MNPSQLQIADYDYDLPVERIARYPLAERDASKLLVYRAGEISEGSYRDIDQVIPARALLVFNNTKVIQARLKFETPTGATIEVFCLEPAAENPEQASAMNQTGSVYWTCLIGKAAKWKEGTLRQVIGPLTLTAERLEKIGGTYKVKFSWTPSKLSFAEVLTQTGEIPIPPYLKRESAAIDQTRYQTIYAEHEGSVAAPTAGLHFTAAVFEKLRARGVDQDYVTLHVGAGTFKPVKSETIAGHDMHAEWIEVGTGLLEKLLRAVSSSTDRQRIIAVGTTSLRTLESVYWMGVKAHHKPDATLRELEIAQWDPYVLPQGVGCQTSLSALLTWLRAQHLDLLVCKTQVLLAPPYRLRIADALVTNFHQPKSTLLLLIATLVGEDWKRIYAYAMENDYRFLSYGDGSILFR